jgi:HlyD family secretion protein
MSVRRSLLVLATLMLALPFVVFSWRTSQLQRRDSGQNLQYYTVGRGDLDVAVTSIGTVEAEAVVNMSFNRAGRVNEVLVQLGDFVQAGDVLAKQISETEQLAVDQAALSLQLAELRKQDLLEPADDSQVRIAEANVDSAWGAYTALQSAVAPEDVQAAEIRVQQAQEAYDSAVYDRTHAQGGQVDQFYQLLDAQVGEASFNLEIARLQLESLQNGNSGSLNVAYARVLQAQRALEQVQAGPTQAEIDQADNAIEQARAQLDNAQAVLDQMSITAPFAGVVSAVNIDVGALGVPGFPAFELTDLSALHVDAQVDEIDIQQVHEGVSTTVRLDALPGMALAGVLDQIALIGTNDNGIISYDVQVGMTELDPRVRVGMTAEVSIIVEERKDILLVPNLYIRLDRERNQAFVNRVQPDGTLQEIEVTLGLQGQDSSEVLSGLQLGDMIAVDLSSDAISFLGG